VPTETASTLSALKSTTENMNKGVQDQRSQVHAPAVAIDYNVAMGQLSIKNQGKATLTLLSVSVGDQHIPTSSLLLAPDTSDVVEVDLLKIFNQSLQGSSVSVPVLIRVRSDDNREYNVQSAVVKLPVGSRAVFRTQTTAVTAVTKP